MVPQEALSPRRATLQYQPPTAQPRPSVLQPVNPRATDTPTNTGPLPAFNSSMASGSTTGPREPNSAAGPWQANDRQMLLSPGHLNDVAFTDAQTGVAVGIQGLIWRTSDGGRRWSAVRSDWNGDLQSIVFADAKNGWIVGGRALPIRGLHEGIVLRTQDGGVTWRQMSTTLLTKLTRIGYDQKLKKLWAVGEPDGQYPSGLFESFDLGQNWNDVRFQLDSDDSNGAKSIESIGSSENVGICVGDEWVVSNRLGIFRGVGDRAAPVVISTSPNGSPPQTQALRFREIRVLGNRLAALGTDGQLYLSRNRGQKWELVGGLPPVQDGGEFRLMTTSGDSLWLAPRVGQQLYRFDSDRQLWAVQTLPTPEQLNRIQFVDPRMGWAVGTHGQVWSTQDGGQSWQLQHRSHAGLAILMVAATAEDIPPELVAHLAVNQGLQVGVLCGRTELPRGVSEQAFWQNDVASVLIDPVPFDPQQPTEVLARRTQGYLSALQPRVILVCPPQPDASSSAARRVETRLQVQAPVWLEAAQAQRERRGVDAGLGVERGVAVIATIANGDGETSISSQALATNVGQLLDDVAWQSKTLIANWRSSDSTKSSRQVRPKSWGIRRLAMLEPVDMSWFHPQTAKLDSFGRTLPTRPIRTRTSATNLDAINQMARKSSWIHQLHRVPTSTGVAREQWQRSMFDQLAIPDSLHGVWLSDLADYCSTNGDTRKATLARWHVVQSALDRPEGLAALLPTLRWLISEEVQWEAQLEARAERLKRFAELQKLFAEEEAEGELSEEERRRKALHRFGVEPGMEQHVPAAAVEKILLLDKAQREATRAGRIKPDPEIARLAAVPQTRMVTDTQSQQLQNKLGQLQQHTMTVSWDSPLKSDTAPTTNQPQTYSNSVVDLSSEQRLQMAAGLIRRADSLWPSLNGLPEWWRMKARVRQELRDAAQTEVAWNRLIEMTNNPWLAGSIYNPGVPLSELDELRTVSLAIAEHGERFRLESLRTTAGVHSISQAGATSNANRTGTHVRSLPVHWTLDRPYLDGHFSETFWHGGSSDQPIRLAQDEQYLYVAIQVPVAFLGSGSDPRLATGNPIADQGRDQAALDRGLVLLIDTDGDELNSFRITIDSLGRISDHQNGLGHWNPAIFVSQRRDSADVSIEMAIDLEDLSPVRAGKPWQIQLQAQADGRVQSLEKAWLQLTDLFGE